MIVSEYHDKNKAQKAKQNFEKIFSKKEMPDDISEFRVKHEKIMVSDLITEIGFAQSKSEARRLIEQKAVSIDGNKIEAIDAEIHLDKKGIIIKVGKRRIGKVFLV